MAVYQRRAFSYNEKEDIILHKVISVDVPDDASIEEIQEKVELAEEEGLDEFILLGGGLWATFEIELNKEEAEAKFCEYIEYVMSLRKNRPRQDVMRDIKCIDCIAFKAQSLRQ